MTARGDSAGKEGCAELTVRKGSAAIGVSGCKAEIFTGLSKVMNGLYGGVIARSRAEKREGDEAISSVSQPKARDGFLSQVLGLGT
ncbi:MAG: hypothetical protein AVDCRST_MAG56-523 [uncultured Cytophagales bacterium]|uniref:Uncharacterized protein n=1 Tax=uncultured Cytophagales bacterium TaxID=158755 RepID=A0A6J4HGR3_9SPHI|nr:MAG: hypothetical protein AVDCRST_MAG56-523 [uncultured Cytophagales bacterium]